MSILITGGAGFIGFHLAKRLLSNNQKIIVIDNLNDYYDVKLKLDRLKILEKYDNFSFYRGDINDEGLLNKIRLDFNNIDIIIHLAAQAGVRYSLKNPKSYIDSNISGYVKILEFAKELPELKHLLFASSSSVYGINNDIPFKIESRIDKPISLYAATKSSGELISYTYSHLYSIPITILRFFTVYGPWGRPDMGMYLFTKAIYKNRPIELYNGNIKRDFTYITDIISGIENSISIIPKGNIPIKTYNLGNNKSELLTDFIKIIENNIGKKAIIVNKKLPKTDSVETYADITNSRIDLKFDPKITIDQGIPKFINWFKSYYDYK